MKKKMKKLSLIALSLVLVTGLFAGCGPAKPKPEEAQAYVKAVLDVICLGDYDHSVIITDIEQGKEGEVRDDVIDQMLTALGGKGISDDVTNRFKDCLIDAFSKARYSVGDAVATDDGGYDVPVTIEPLQLLRSFNDNFESTLQAKVMADYDRVMAMSEAEQSDFIMDVVIDMMNDNLADPQYDAPETVTVHYGLMDEENNVYGCTSEEGEKLGEKIFSAEGMY